MSFSISSGLANHLVEQYKNMHTNSTDNPESNITCGIINRANNGHKQFTYEATTENALSKDDLRTIVSELNRAGFGVSTMGVPTGTIIHVVW